MGYCDRSRSQSGGSGIMTTTVTNIEKNTYLVEVFFLDEGVDATTSNTIIGTEDQAYAYAPVLARDFRENNPDLFPLPEPEINPMEEMI